MILCNDVFVESNRSFDQREYEQIWRDERARVLATLIRLLGSFDLAEEATQEAFSAALTSWPKNGMPLNPRAWLISAGRNKVVDQLRRSQVEERRAAQAARSGGWVTDSEAVAPQQEALVDEDEESVEDDRLRLIFTCCHPALAQEAQVALTLRTLGGLSTEAIARAFLKPVATIAQRIVRAKSKIRDARIPYRVPRREELDARLDAVLLVVYLVFNEGYGAGPREQERRTMCEEAIRLGRLLLELMLKEPEVRGLLALMLLQHARTAARFTRDGDLVLLEEQDRSLWNENAIEEGAQLTAEALRAGVGVYAVQAAIAAVHGHAREARDTDWPQIAALYEVLRRLQPSPVVELNRAVAIAMERGAWIGLQMIDALQGLDEYCPYWAARAQMLLWMDRRAEAEKAYRRAAELALAAGDEAQERFFKRRIAEIAALERRPLPELKQ